MDLCNRRLLSYEDAARMNVSLQVSQHLGVPERHCPVVLLDTMLPVGVQADRSCTNRDRVPFALLSPRWHVGI